MVPISWFFRYETLDEVKEVAWWWLSMVPLLIAMLLVIKALFALSAAVMLHRKKACTDARRRASASDLDGDRRFAFGADAHADPEHARDHAVDLGRNGGGRPAGQRVVDADQCRR